MIYKPMNKREGLPSRHFAIAAAKPEERPAGKRRGGGVKCKPAIKFTKGGRL